MKKVILFTAVLLAFHGFCQQAVAQNEEYYKPDSLRGKPRQTTIIIPDADKPKAATPPARSDVPLPLIDRLRLGGSFGLGFGTVTNINLSPMAGFNLTEKLVGGVGVTYMWFTSRRFNVNSSYYGGRSFLMYSLFPMITLQAEYEGLNVEYFNSLEQKYTRTWIGSPMVGAAYTQPLGARFTRGVHMTLLYNLNYSNQLNPFTGQNISPYSGPFVFRVTFL
ncbi:hypothetical protein [Arundinibacter roseus]|uniref:Outer membrane protein beta-barrel domain-containing protein n=1 Tax=Arundinibacter roseus TaxID=2070510 RepID=A0A4R4K865_9BACT|nr:hypothetical protein [Arundinibacter roseus]TDB63770.1 hypothetical protein EZE20_15880 [Arundinibacter roseus]